MEQLLSPDFLDWVKKNKFSNSTILELGSGNSTLFFSKYFKRVYSYENELEWYNKVKFHSNTSPNIIPNFFDKGVFKDLEFKERVYESDLILIDNNPNFISRYDFAYFVHNNKKENSIIVLDNGEWNIEAYEFLRTKYYCRDYVWRRGKNSKGVLTQTTVFFLPRKDN